MSVAVGMLSVSFEVIMDTRSDLIWTQCKPCEDGLSQIIPFFDPSESFTFSTIPCGDYLCDNLGSKKTRCTSNYTFMCQYGDISFTSGDLDFKIVRGKIKGVEFGCEHDNEGRGFSQGSILVGLGGGGLSLISQLSSKEENMISFHLLSIIDSSSQTIPLIFGEVSSLGGGKTMGLIKSSTIPTFQYIHVTGISLNAKVIDTPSGTFYL